MSLRNLSSLGVFGVSSFMLRNQTHHLQRIICVHVFFNVCDFVSFHSVVGHWCILVHNNFHTQEYVCLLCGFFHTRFFHHHAWNVCHVKGNEKMALKHWDKRKKKPHKTSSLMESPSNLILCMKQLCAILLLLRSFITPKGQLQKKKERRQMPH